MGRADEEGESADLAEQPDLKRRKRDDDDEGESIIPMDVLLLIFARLSVVNLIRSGVVCVSWRSAMKKKHSLSPRTIRPWLALPKEIMAPAPNHRALFLDTNTGKTYTIHLPELHQKRLVGKSDHGFLVYEDQLSNCLSMIIPITRATICFPPLPAPHCRVNRVLVVSSSSPCSSKEEVSTSTGYTVAIIRGKSFMVFAAARNLKTLHLSILDRIYVSELHICGKKFCGLYRQNPPRSDAYYQFFTCDLHDYTGFKMWAFKFYSCPWSLSDFGGSFPDHESDDECEDPNDCLRFCCETFYYPVILPNGDLIVI